MALGEEPDRLFVEAKLLRLLEDNGKPNDNMLMHILSPYPQHHSAVTDCEKLRAARFPGRSAILIFGYGYEGWPLEPAIDAFERMVRGKGRLGERHEAPFANLCPPGRRGVHVASGLSRTISGNSRVLLSRAA